MIKKKKKKEEEKKKKKKNKIIVQYDFLMYIMSIKVVNFQALRNVQLFDSFLEIPFRF